MSGSGISWAICKSAPRSGQITTPAPHHSVFYRPVPILPPNQQRQSTEGKYFPLRRSPKLATARRSRCQQNSSSSTVEPYDNRRRRRWIRAALAARRRSRDNWPGWPRPNSARQRTKSCCRQSLTISKINYSGRASELGGIINSVNQRWSSLSRSERTPLPSLVDSPWRNFLSPEFMKKFQREVYTLIL